MHYGEAGTALCGDRDGVVVAAWVRVTCPGCLLLGAPAAWDEHGVPRCQFGLCRRLAELELILAEGREVLVVCGLHVTPVVAWGLPASVSVSRVRRLAA